MWSTIHHTVSNNLSKVCYSTSVTPQSIQECIHTHGIERATEVNDQQMPALHILCTNPHVTVDSIRAYRYLQLAPEAANQEDSGGMTPFQHLCRNAITFLEDRSFSSLMAWWYCCMPPQTELGKKRKRGWSWVWRNIVDTVCLCHYNWSIGDVKI